MTDVSGLHPLASIVTWNEEMTNILYKITIRIELSHVKNTNARNAKYARTAYISICTVHDRVMHAQNLWIYSTRVHPRARRARNLDAKNLKVVQIGSTIFLASVTNLR